MSKNQREAGTGKPPKETKLIDVLKDFVNIHNEELNDQCKDLNSIASSELKKSLGIERIVCPKSLSEHPIKLTKMDTTTGQFLRTLNSYACGYYNDKPYCEWVVALSGNTINVTRIVPPDWEERAKEKGYDTAEAQRLYYNANYKTEEYDVYSGSNWKNEEKADSSSSVVFLNYVKSAYRNENVIYCTTIYDDRIRPGSFCAIQGNAIMGRHSGRGGRSGSRLIHLTNQVVLFRVTGGVNFEFSTTEDSSMSLIGVIVNEDWTPPSKGNKDKGKSDLVATIKR